MDFDLDLRSALETLDTWRKGSFGVLFFNAEAIRRGNSLRALESTKLGACAVRAPLRPHARASMAMPSRPLLFSRASAPRRLCVEKTKAISYIIPNIF